jgi:hypothetical protein
MQSGVISPGIKVNIIWNQPAPEIDKDQYGQDWN